MAISVDNVPETIVAPKDIATLEKIATERNAERKVQEAAEQDDKIKITDEVIVLDNIEDLSAPKIDVEILS